MLAIIVSIRSGHTSVVESHISYCNHTTSGTQTAYFIGKKIF